ncbi:amidohydrolase family protein [Candidatus Epulonipiscium viviparus]|uniref:amidohydrolase family protein n=1 Tax=Candidatus Epulonipiscium viviparus TaxID=420336 RepID=UPI0027380789|nr:amidohydrolase family protein [Candidatus Epulopiscium viviparus]
MQQIIDAHFHIFDPDRFCVEWLKEVDILNRPILLSEFEALAEGDDYKVVGAVHVELDTIAAQKKAENDYFVQLAADRSDFVKSVVLYADLLDPDMEQSLAEYTNKNSVAGVRYILHFDNTPAKTCLNPTFIENVKQLGKMNLHFEACIRPGELADLYQLAKQCPETLIVLNHMGLPDVTANIEETDKWKQGIKLLASLDNVVCKISGLSSSDVTIITPFVEYCLDLFGEKRVMFASNFPVCNLSITFDDWTKAMLKIFETRPAKDLFFYKNAMNIYHIGGLSNDQ